MAGLAFSSWHWKSMPGILKTAQTKNSIHIQQKASFLENYLFSRMCLHNLFHLITERANECFESSRKSLFQYWPNCKCKTSISTEQQIGLVPKRKLVSVQRVYDRSLAGLDQSNQVYFWSQREIGAAALLVVIVAIKSHILKLEVKLLHISTSQRPQGRIKSELVQLWIKTMENLKAAFEFGGACFSQLG